MDFQGLFQQVANVSTVYNSEPVWEHQKTLGTVEKGQFEMTSSTGVGRDGESFTTNSIKMVNNGNAVYVQVKGGEPLDAERYEIAEFVALRDVAGTTISTGEVRLKAIAK
jgi:hypothetical protein